MTFFVTSLLAAGPSRPPFFPSTASRPRADLGLDAFFRSGVNVQNKTPPIIPRYDARQLENISKGLKLAAGEAYKAVRPFIFSPSSSLADCPVHSLSCSPRRTLSSSWSSFPRATRSSTRRSSVPRVRPLRSPPLLFENDFADADDAPTLQCRSSSFLWPPSASSRPSSGESLLLHILFISCLPRSCVVLTAFRRSAGTSADFRSTAATSR